MFKKGDFYLRNFEEDYSLVRVLHAVPDGEEVDVYINGFPFYSDIQFAQFTPYIYVPEGEYVFSVYLKDEKEKPLLETKIKINSEELITAAIITTKDGIKLLRIPEEMGIPDGDKSKIKFVHLVPNAPAVNILLDENEVFKNVEYAMYTNYEEIPPKEYKMDIELSENKKTVTSNQININPNRVYTFYAIGNAPNVDIIQTLDGATFLN